MRERIKKEIIIWSYSHNIKPLNIDKLVDRILEHIVHAAKTE